VHPCSDRAPDPGATKNHALPLAPQHTQSSTILEAQALGPGNTRQRLLDAAFRAFAENGFHGASIRDICERAGANIATANYHFHGKVRLYKAVVEYACQRIRAPRSLPDEQPARQTPEQKLRAGIQSLFCSLMQQDDSAWLIRLVVRELAEQGPPFDCVAAALGTHAARLEEPLHELLGPHAISDCVHLCALSLVSQCVIFARRNRRSNGCVRSSGRGTPSGAVDRPRCPVRRGGSGTLGGRIGKARPHEKATHEQADAMTTMLVLLAACILVCGWIWQRESSGSRGEDGPRRPPPEKPPRLPNESKPKTGLKP